MSVNVHELAQLPYGKAREALNRIEAEQEAEEATKARAGQAKSGSVWVAKVTLVDGAEEHIELRARSPRQAMTRAIQQMGARPQSLGDSVTVTVERQE